VKTDDDLILFFARTLRELEPSVPESTVQRVEQRMREQFGGERVYVAKPLGVGDSPRQHWYPGIRAAELAQRAKCSRRTAYRWMARLRD